MSWASKNGFPLANIEGTNHVIGRYWGYANNNEYMERWKLLSDEQREHFGSNQTAKLTEGYYFRSSTRNNGGFTHVAYDKKAQRAYVIEALR